MSSTYTKHYQDSLDRKTENNDVVRRLLVVDNNLANISQGVNALGTSNVGNAIAALDVQVGLIPRTNYSSNFSAVGNQLTRIENTANAIPTYNASNGVAQLIGGQSNQAIVIGGISSDTQAIRNNDIPRLATGNQANALSSSIASGRNESNAIPRNTYNAQLNAIQATGNATSTESQNIPRATYNSNFATVNTKLDNLSTQVSGISSSGGGGASSVVALNLTSLTVPYNVNNAGLDLLWCLGVGEGAAYVNPHSSKIFMSASSTAGGAASNLINRGDDDFYSSNIANGWIQIDIATGGTARRIILTGLGLKSRLAQAGFGQHFALNLVIEGSNDGTNFINIFNWNSIGFNAHLQWKYSIFSNAILYRYVRIRQPGLDSTGMNYLTGSEIRLYGTIDNP